MDESLLALSPPPDDPDPLLSPGSHLLRRTLVWTLAAFLFAFVMASLFVGGGLFQVFTGRPPANLDVQADATTYMLLWGEGTKQLPPHFAPSDDADAMRRYALTFLWDAYPSLSEVPEAQNLALKWPPRRGARYRLAAYPFVQTSKDPLPIAVGKALWKMTNKYADQATPPAWFISVYDDQDWTSKNIFLPPGATKTAGLKDSDTTHMTCRCSRIFGRFRWVEVVRTCYPVQKDSYPLCDDGGQWYYHAPGSGTWYNLGNCLVRYNKIDAAVYCMAQMGLLYVQSSSTKLLDLSSVFRGSQGDVAEMHPLLPVPKARLPEYVATYAKLLDTDGCTLDDYKGQSTWPEFWATAKRHFARRLQRNVGEKSFVKAVSRLVKDARASGAAGSLKLEGFLPFQAFRARNGQAVEGYVTLLACIGGLLALAAFFVVALPAGLFGACSLALPAALLVLVLGGAWLFWAAGLDAFVASQGANMIARGLSLYGVTVDEVVDFCVEPVVEGPDSERQQFFSGLSSSWIADLSIEIFSSMLGYDVVVMHTQPNKSGTYQVEMCDVTKIKSAFGLAPAEPAWWAGGTCGDADAAPGGFGCQDCPWTGSRKGSLSARGGLCFNGLVPTLPSNYATLNWTTPGGWRPAADEPFEQETTFDQTTGNLTPAGLKQAEAWLGLYRAVPCVCREGKDAMCIGCEGTVSDLLCNWSHRGRLPTGPAAATRAH